VGSKVYKTTYDDEDGQDEEVTEFSIDIDDMFEKDNSGDFTVYIYNTLYEKARFSEIMIKDLGFAAISICLVFLYMWFTLRSFWMTFNSILNIVFSFPMTLVIYKGVL